MGRRSFIHSRLAYNIMPAGQDVKGGKAVYFTIDIHALAVSFRHTLRKEYGQLSVNPAPILPSSGPFFGNVYHRQVQHFQQAVVRWKHRLGLGYFAQLTVKPLNGVGGVNQFPYFLRVLEIGAEIGPVSPPGL